MVGITGSNVIMIDKIRYMAWHIIDETYVQIIPKITSGNCIGSALAMDLAVRIPILMHYTQWLDN